MNFKIRMMAAMVLPLLTLGGGMALAGARDAAPNRSPVRVMSAGDDTSRAGCTPSARTVSRACKYAVRGDYWLAVARCQNLSSRDELESCREEAQEELAESREGCVDQAGGSS